MTVFDWLITPGGIEASHALVLLLVAVTAAINLQIKRAVDKNAKKLNGHLESHKILTEEPIDHSG